jgi:hypothetical protein
MEGFCEHDDEPSGLIKEVSVNFSFTQQRTESEFSDMLAEFYCTLSEKLAATVQCGQPAASGQGCRYRSQYTRFLSSHAIKGSCLKSGAVVSRRAFPLLRQLLKQPCPNREGNELATDRTASVSLALAR